MQKKNLVYIKEINIFQKNTLKKVFNKVSKVIDGSSESSHMTPISWRLNCINFLDKFVEATIKTLLDKIFIAEYDKKDDALEDKLTFQGKI